MSLICDIKQVESMGVLTEPCQTLHAISNSLLSLAKPLRCALAKGDRHPYPQQQLY